MEIWASLPATLHRSKVKGAFPAGTARDHNVSVELIVSPRVRVFFVAVSCRRSLTGHFFVFLSNMLDLTQRIVFCALLASVYASCPPRCECSEAAHTVKCVSKDLQSIPTGIPGYTRNLFITGNQISRLGPESFKGLENVTNLSLSNNR